MGTKIEKEQAEEEIILRFPLISPELCALVNKTRGASASDLKY